MTDITVELDPGEVIALPVQPTSVDVPVIQSDCRLVGWPLRDTSTPSFAEGEGSVLSPGAGAQPVTIAGLRAGTYDVTWTVSLQAAAAAADANNFQLRLNAAAILNSVNAGAAGAYPQGRARVTLPPNPTTTLNPIP